MAPLEREQLENMDPRGFKDCIDQLGEHSENGAAMTLREVQMRRPLPFGKSKKTVPTLRRRGRPRSAPPFLKRTIASAGPVHAA